MYAPQTLIEEAKLTPTQLIEQGLREQEQERQQRSAGNQLSALPETVAQVEARLGRKPTATELIEIGMTQSQPSFGG